MNILNDLKRQVEQQNQPQIQQTSMLPKPQQQPQLQQQAQLHHPEKCKKVPKKSRGSLWRKSRKKIQCSRN